MPPSPAPPRVLDARYELFERLGRGGMAEVIRGWDRRLRRDVAIKFLAPRYSQDAGVADRFRQEIATLAQLDHPNVVTIFDTGETDDGRLYLVMERLQGETLDQTLRALRGRGEAMGWRRLAAIGRQICGALHSAHSRQIVHRDIKPSNIFRLRVDGDLDRDFVKLLDFGIAKVVAGSMEADEEEGRPPVTAMGAFVGTPHYAAPELIAPERHGSPDLRADIFSLGVLLYECAAGVLPYEGIPKVAVLSRTALETLPSPRERAPEREIPRELEAIIVRATALSPGDRHASALELSEALAAFEASISHGPFIAKPAPPGVVDEFRAGGAAALAAGAKVDLVKRPPAPDDEESARDERSWSLPAGYGKRRPPGPQAPRMSVSRASAVSGSVPSSVATRSAEAAEIKVVGAIHSASPDADERTTHQRIEGPPRGALPDDAATVEPAAAVDVAGEILVSDNPATDVPVEGAAESTSPSPVELVPEGVSGTSLWGTLIAGVLALLVVATWVWMPPVADKERREVEIIPSRVLTPSIAEAPESAVERADDSPPPTREPAPGSSAGAPEDAGTSALGIDEDDEPIYAEESVNPEDARLAACRVSLKNALRGAESLIKFCLSTNGVLIGPRDLEVRVRVAIAERGDRQVSVLSTNFESPRARTCVITRLSTLPVGCEVPGTTRTFKYFIPRAGGAGAP